MKVTKRKKDHPIWKGYFHSLHFCIKGDNLLTVSKSLLINLTVQVNNRSSLVIETCLNDRCGLKIIFNYSRDQWFNRFGGIWLRKGFIQTTSPPPSVDQFFRILTCWTVHSLFMMHMWLFILVWIASEILGFILARNVSIHVDDFIFFLFSIFLLGVSLWCHGSHVELGYCSMQVRSSVAYSILD